MEDMRPQSTETLAEPAHEQYELTLRGIVIFAVVLGIVSAVCMVGLRIVMGRLEARQQANLEQRPARLADASGQFTGPNLQENPAVDLVDRRQDEVRRLTSYEYDKKGGSARIPIDRAIDVLAQKGLPTGQPAPKSSGGDEPKGAP
jgi:hypothetical protein